MSPLMASGADSEEDVLYCRMRESLTILFETPAHSWGDCMLVGEVL